MTALALHLLPEIAVGLALVLGLAFCAGLILGHCRAYHQAFRSAYDEYLDSLHDLRAETERLQDRVMEYQTTEPYSRGYLDGQDSMVAWLNKAKADSDRLLGHQVS